MNADETGREALVRETPGREVPGREALVRETPVRDLPVGDASVHVVAAALVRDGRVLAARRSAPHRLAGGWEFPGGKVEPGEDEADALARECREELGVDVAVGVELAQTTGGGIRLVLFAATLSSGEPAPLEDHDELRWLGVDEVDSIAWLPIDRVLLPVVTQHLRDRNRGGRL